MNGFLTLLGITRTVFTAPSHGIFTDLVTGRRTITHIITVTGPAGRRAHDAYHRFLRAGAWSMSRLWQALDTHLIGPFHGWSTMVDQPWKGPGSSVTRSAPRSAGSSTPVA